jgi:3-hydroxyacyl-CoA dehydrogenase/enoyl-CoA hydratase/3-hydroxybutyryl-CoA epimerase
VQSIGKTPVVVKDSPGFVVNRVLMPYLMDAVKLFEQGQPPELIDDAMLDFGMPMGPMRLLDEIGLDVAVHVGKTLATAFPERMSTSALLENMVAKGWLGKKTGRGFYEHKAKGAVANADALALRVSGAAPMAAAELQSRLANQLSHEARLCLDEGIASSARDIDLAMILGTGYAPFRGGPLAYIGLPEHHIEIMAPTDSHC